MSSIFDWSTTAADNATADSAINWAEGQAPSTVNGSAREMMARVAELLGDIGGALTAGGAANALTVTANSAFEAYADGLLLGLRIATDNTAAATLNVNSIGAKSIRKMLSTGESALTGTELQAGGIYLLAYSEDLNSAAGGWLLLNPTMDFSSFVTLTGSQTLTNKTLTSPTITGATITGAALNGTLGATTPSTVAGTTGAFSGAVTITDGIGFQGVKLIGHSTNWSGHGFSNSSSQLRWGVVYNGGTAGAFAIQRFTGASVYQEDALSIANATGAVTINGTLNATGGVSVDGARLGGAPDAVLEDQKTSGTDGGTFTSGAWQTRALNTEARDPSSLISISSNQFTPTVAGWVEWSAPASRCGGHKSRLFNVTDSAVVAVGSGELTQSGSSFVTRSVGGAAVVAGKAYRIEHQCEITQATNGFGNAAGFSSTEVYTRVQFWRTA